MTLASERRRSDVFRPGSIVGGKYLIQEEVGAGGMGRVFAAEHLLLEQRCAIKVMRDDVASERRFRREARAAQALRSRHIVAVYDIGVEAGSPYIVMELLLGETLAQKLARSSRLPLDETIRYVHQAAEGLAEAHRAGVIHRDVKPSNLFLVHRDEQPLIKVVDFGISRAPDSEDLGERTAEHALLGSPYYMSPEQLRDPNRVDTRTDVWSLGVTLYTLLTGVRPFAGKSVSEIAINIATEFPAPMHELTPELPPELDPILRRALAKRPEERFATTTELAAELVAVVDRRRSPTIVGSSSPAPAITGRGACGSPTESMGEATATLREEPIVSSRASHPPRAVLWIGAGVLLASIAGATTIVSNDEPRAGPKLQRFETPALPVFAPPSSRTTRVPSSPTNVTAAPTATSANKSRRVARKKVEPPRVPTGRVVDIDGIPILD